MSPPTPQAVMPLLPGIPAMGESLDVALSDLPPDTQLHSDPPSALFLDSVKNLGILQPIQLIRTSRGASPYIVAAGRRRIKAARATGMESIPAIVFPEGWVRPAVLAIAENEQRSTNDLSDLLAIESMRQEGFTDEQIRDSIGMGKPRFESIVVMQKLLPELRAALEQGKISIGLSRAIAPLPSAEQQKLLPALRAGSLDYKTYRKVYDEYQAAKKAAGGGTALPGVATTAPAATAATPPAASNPAPAPAPAPATWANTALPWQERAKLLLHEELRAIVPDTEADTLKLIAQLERLLDRALEA
ncbi:MAG: ParB/RepB/Spo0J family partition protein [Candidatus Viridilinea halotolerans]|uniref:ParB/RepB/Spo0J family partition protein n=1 Tax=Candidatus Viridilinea halotolerans TaxID=2491704 RepID=A0A426U8B2_9CHLR|nr:MAG: ParB/RepB/Spo0J family partition protein [Candidatus Viridilinea halotolerans]